MTHYDPESLKAYVDTEQFMSTYLRGIEDEDLRNDVRGLISDAVAGDPKVEGMQPLGMLGQYLGTVIEDAENEMRGRGMDDDDAINAALSVVEAAIERVKTVAEQPALGVADVAGPHIL